MTARLAMLAHTVASVRRESRVWVRNLVGEGHATVQRNRQAGEKELAAEGMKRTVGVALFLALTFTLARPGFTQTK